VNWLDWIIIGVFVFFIFRGYHKGFIQQLFELAGSVIALLVAFIYYPRLGRVLAELIHFSETFTNILGFILIVTLISGAAGLIGRSWRARRQNEAGIFFDGGLGAVFGGAKAAIIMIMVLLVLLSFPGGFFAGQVGASTFSQDLLRLTPLFYQLQDRVLPRDFPRMVVSPEGLALRSGEYRQLETATCVNCGTQVEYRGLARQGLFSYPQYYCPKCHRTSDGCLTFEGYHLLKGKCPYEAFGRNTSYDCKIWPNSQPSKVRGRCPVCGRRE
jgi:membrane protein required for colicin V production